MANTKVLLIKEISKKKKANVRQSNNKDLMNSSLTALSA
jgi:hypothetical protein